jgi:hypothetical protein
MTSMYDMNDAEPQRSGELIPDGTFAKLTMIIKPGGADGQTEIDAGLLKPSNQPGSDVLSIDGEFTVIEGPHAKRKFWQTLTVSGGKVDENGVSIGWKITKSTIRAMIDSALGLNPEDVSEGAKQKRILRGLADLGGITFVGKVKVESSTDSRYSDSNRLDRVILPTETEWQKVMNGENVPPKPSSSRAKAATGGSTNSQPAWGQGQQATASAAGQPAWQSAPAQSSAATQAPAPAQPAAEAPASQGPAWLNG